MKEMQYHGQKLKVVIGSYSDGSPAISLLTEDDRLFAVLTVNLGDGFFSDSGACIQSVDVNNLPGIEEILADVDWAEPVDLNRTSGYVSYPFYRFDLVDLGEEV